MNRSELVRLARVGAEARLQVLRTEMEGILRQFPELKRGRSAPAPRTEPTRANGSARRRRRPEMSAAARKRISDVQKKRWAEWRKKNKRASES